MLWGDRTKTAMPARLGRWAGQRRSAGTAILAVLAALPACGQAIREIDDPSTGERWVLSGDDLHPGGPGRWTRISPQISPQVSQGLSARFRSSGVGNEAARARARALVIHSGDEVTVEEHTAVADARLQAVALAAAAAGERLRARLNVGGKIIEAVALGRGRAVFASERGAGQ